jgi:hypothetical protein
MINRRTQRGVLNQLMADGRWQIANVRARSVVQEGLTELRRKR